VNSLGHHLAVIEWAKDSDGLDCSAVWPEYDANPNQDFGKEYYDRVKNMIDVQLAKGGIRLATWLNALAEDC
jgi:hypothetical protein